MLTTKMLLDKYYELFPMTAEERRRMEAQREEAARRGGRIVACRPGLGEGADA